MASEILLVETGRPGREAVVPDPPTWRRQLHQEIQRYCWYRGADAMTGGLVSEITAWFMCTCLRSALFHNTSSRY